VSWFRKASGECGDDYEGFFGELCEVEPGAGRLLFLPYLTGERAPLWDPDARGAFVGLTLNHGRPQMARAVVESTAFAMRDVILTMESLGGSVTELRVTGNPARNPIWNQIKADITGKVLNVTYSAQDTACLGAAILAGKAAGVFESIEAAVDSMVKIKKCYEPNMENHAIYKKAYEKYKLLFKSLEPLFAMEGQD
jgi:xylulokinase